MQNLATNCECCHAKMSLPEISFSQTFFEIFKRRLGIRELDHDVEELQIDLTLTANRDCFIRKLKTSYLT